MNRLTKFELNGKSHQVEYIETQQVKEGVTCDIYNFVDDDTCDLGVVTVKAGVSTPRQKVLSGDKTIEGFMSGSGVLEVINEDQSTVMCEFPGGQQEVAVSVGDTMQWSAQTDLCFYEICYPPYTDGRFQNLD